MLDTRSGQRDQYGWIVRCGRELNARQHLRELQLEYAQHEEVLGCNIDHQPTDTVKLGIGLIGEPFGRLRGRELIKIEIGQSLSLMKGLNSFDKFRLEPLGVILHGRSPSARSLRSPHFCLIQIQTRLFRQDPTTPLALWVFLLHSETDAQRRP